MRVEESGVYTEDGHLNCELAVMQALGGWHMKLPIEVRQMVLSEDDEFMIIGCDGIWDVVSNQEAVGVATSYGLQYPQITETEIVFDVLKGELD
uniref:PPM-type phosphatase domain-containing protein n=1 Tax=Lactuca sativa TaxID=4236 RepID=A0A9R1VV35_LACSA|nr:hypothetical protein LSAT_V11C400172970 [Lactuca sativa]